MQINTSPLKDFFEIALVTDKDKNILYDQIVQHFKLPRTEILIVDDRTLRGIQYGNQQGHPTVWLQKGKFAHELPNAETGLPTYTITSLEQLKTIL